ELRLGRIGETKQPGSESTQDFFVSGRRRRCIPGAIVRHPGSDHWNSFGKLTSTHELGRPAGDKIAVISREEEPLSKRWTGRTRSCDGEIRQNVNWSLP
ncbi:hypothetical protein T310_8680, partial [Rasamsonia emersonii CBS 393.64]